MNARGALGRYGEEVAVRALQAAGLIRYSRGVVDILDRAGLEAISCECYRRVRDNYERLLDMDFDQRLAG